MSDREKDRVAKAEPIPVPFRFVIGVPFDQGNWTSLQGGIVWGEGGWLVSNSDMDYQAPIEMTQTAAVLEWLRRFFHLQ